MVVTLTIGEHLNSGRENLVFQHPNDPNLLIKVIIPTWLKKQNFPELTVKEPKASKVYEKWKWEIKAISAATMRAGHVLDFLQAHYGFCDTTLGLGIVVGKVADSVGNLAPTLQEITENGLHPTQKIHGMLDAILDQTAQVGLITWDISAGNFVVTGEPGAERLVLIDGIGDRALLPLREYSSWLADRSRQQKRAVMHEWVRKNYNTANKTPQT